MCHKMLQTFLYILDENRLYIVIMKSFSGFLNELLSVKLRKQCQIRDSEKNIYPLER